MSDISAGRRSAPARLVLVRHGESVGNVADREANARRASRLDVTTRDADTPLSAVGEHQATALGSWLGRQPDGERPDVAISSPYARALSTARLAVGELGVDVLVDERLRERDLGAFDGMTGYGIRAEFPEEAARRTQVGKFYYRPPGGESWTDVVLRVRSALADIRAEYDDCRVWVFSHQAVIMAFRYVLEAMDEARVLDIDRTTPVANCSMTTYDRGDDGALSLVRFADTTPVDESPAPTTHEDPHAQPEAEAGTSGG